MADDDECSASGAPIYRHAGRSTPFTIPDHSADHCEEITAHAEKHIGKVDFVLDKKRANVALKRGWFRW